jgi:hypothetical protein
MDNWAGSGLAPKKASENLCRIVDNENATGSENMLLTARDSCGTRERCRYGDSVGRYNAL